MVAKGRGRCHDVMTPEAQSSNTRSSGRGEVGEAQGKELQPLGTLDFFCKYFAFSGLSVYKRVGV